MTRVADLFADIFISKGVNKVFLLSGGGIMHLLDGLASNKDIEIINYHHEQAAGIAAEAYSRITERFGVCYATSGPGATNIVTSVAGAWIDSIPMVFITGQSKISQTIRTSKIENLRQFGTFEVDSISIMENITKFSYFLDNPEDAKYILEKAIFIAQEGRPGPVHIEIPLNIQGAIVSEKKLKGYFPVSNNTKVSNEDLSKVINRIKKSEKPVIVAGHGVRISKSSCCFNQLVELLKIPIVTTPLGKDIIEYNNPYFIGHIGLKGTRAGNIAIQNADTIIHIGTSLHTMSTGYELDKYAPNAYKIQIDCDNSNFERENVGVNYKILVDAKQFIENFMSYIQDSNIVFSFDKWVNKLVFLKNKYDVYKENHKIEEKRLNIYKAIECVNKISEEKTIIVNDAGSAFYTVGQAWKLKNNQRIITSGGLGAMGWALPAASGASISSDQSVYCITGDGSLITNIHVLSNISAMKQKIIICVLNNNGYLSIKNTQNNFFNGNYAGVDKKSGVFIPDIKKISSCFDIDYYIANDILALESILEKIKKYDGPVIVDIQCNICQEIIPTVSSKKMQDGSMVSMPLDKMYPFLSSNEELEISSLLI